ncbi:MAG TPA: trehalose-phosphatase [Mycobacteriales bacterium]|nr:trehalose-phosphatase [Mycobacteriales bacterium]
MAGVTDAVAAVRTDPGSALVAVDFDGTLAPIVARPEDSRPAPGAVEALADLVAAGVGGVAIVSGRAADEIVTLAGLPATSGIRVLGHYGLQSWQAGSTSSPAPVEGVERARALLAGLVAESAPGVRLEDKTHSVAVHTRNAADPSGALEALRPRLAEVAAQCGLEAVPGRYVIELRPPGIDKGSALETLASELGSRTVVYAGDDLGDLPAYDAIDRLRHEGITGLTVASVDPADHDVPAEVAARADLVLPGPAAVVAWLAELAAMLNGG